MRISVKKGRLAALALAGTLTTGCAHVKNLSNKQVAIGVGVVVVAGVVIFAMSRSSCIDNSCTGF